jgi:hypothetical protein
VQKSDNLTPFEVRSSNSRAGYAEWLALGAVAAGSVGAIVGMATSRRSAARMSAAESESLEPESITAPHGDKLRGAVV